MSWQAEIPIIVRTLINDWDDQPVYSDDRIIQVITVAAQYVQFDVVLDHVYSVNVTSPDISPDPTVDRDEIFISLVALKASCIIDQSTLRTKAAMEGIRAALGPVSLSVGGSLEGLKIILDKGPCAVYEELTAHWDHLLVINSIPDIYKVILLDLDISTHKRINKCQPPIIILF